MHPTFDTKKLRRTILDMAYAGSGVHIACAFSIVEIMATLYREHLRFPNGDPDAATRDYLVLSKGHGVMAQYACMRELGWLPDEAFSNYLSDGSALKGLPDSRLPGTEVDSGSLGHGFSIGVGLAMGAKLSMTDQKTYVIVGDGEINEGPIWEGCLFASHHQKQCPLPHPRWETRLAQQVFERPGQARPYLETFAARTWLGAPSGPVREPQTLAPLVAHNELTELPECALPVLRR